MKQKREGRTPLRTGQQPEIIGKRPSIHSDTRQERSSYRHIPSALKGARVR